MRITSIKRLMGAVDHPSSFLGDGNRRQIDAIQERLRNGVDTEGTAFDGFKDPSRARYPRPLYHAYKIFQDGAQRIESGIGSVRSVFTIYGVAAKIAHYQNIRRQFLGFSLDDRRAALESVVSGIKKGMQRWR